MPTPIVSLPIAKRLEELGLRREPKLGDSFAFSDGTTVCLHGTVKFWGGRSGRTLSGGANILAESLQKSTWLPRLDQVLDEIERLVPPHCTIEFGLLAGGDHYCVVKDVFLFLKDRGGGIGPTAPKQPDARWRR